MASLKVLAPVVDSQAAAAANTKRIQAFIDAGGGDLAGVGPIYVNGALFVGDDEVLRTTPGNYLKRVDGSGAKLIATKQLAVDWANVAVAWTSGKLATVTWAGHSITAGDAVVLQGQVDTTAADWWRALRVESVIDANSFTVFLPFLPTATPTGTLTAKRCNKNLKIDIDFDFNYSHGTEGNGQDRMASIWAFVADSEIKVRGTDGQKYIGMLAGAINSSIRCDAYPTANSDTLKLYGPLENVTATSAGYGEEDCVSFQAKEPAAYIAYMPCEGNIADLTLSNPDAQAKGGSGVCVVYADPTYSISGVTIDGGRLTGAAGGLPALNLRDGDTFNSARTIKDVTVKRTALRAFNAPIIKLQALKMRKLRLDAVSFLPPDTSTYPCVELTSGSEVDELVFENLEVDFGSFPTSRNFLCTVDGGADARVIVFRNCTFRGASSFFRVLLLSASSSCRRVVFDDCDAEGIDALVQIDALASVAPDVIIRGGSYRSVLTGVSVKTSCRVTLDGVHTTGMSNGAVRADGSGVNVEIHERGCAFDSGSIAFACLNSATVDLKSQHLRADIGATGVNKTAGNVCFNTTAQGTIPADTPVMADGTNWRSILNPSLLF